MNTLLFRLSVTAVLLSASTASRPDVDKVHIATSGHFIKSPALHRHSRQQRIGTESEWTEREFQDGRASERRTSLMQENDQSVVQSDAHLSRGQESDLAVQHELLKLQWEKAKRDFYADAAVTYEHGGNGVADHANNHDPTWLETVPFWICRIAFVAAALHSLLRQRPNMQEKWVATALRWHKEYGAMPLDAAAKLPLDAAAKLPQVINERLGEVERLLTDEAEGPDSGAAEESRAGEGEAAADLPADSLTPPQESTTN